MVSIWSVVDRALVARCVGHHSWVTAVAFDPWRCDERTYRFGSVGDDCRLLLWDFSVGMLHRPRAVSIDIHRSRGSLVHDCKASVRQSISSFVHTGAERSSIATINRVPMSLRSMQEDFDDNDNILHPAPPRSHVAMLPPVLVRCSLRLVVC